MNGWDLFTWICSAGLGLSAILIFGFFLRDAGDIIRGDRAEPDDTLDE
jgi:hypothetical protein